MSNPYPPYGGPQQPGPGVPGGMPAYQPPQPPKASGGKIALLVVAIVAVVLLVFCGGIGLFIWWVFHTVDEAIPDSDRPGGSENPIPVAVGEEFEIDEFEFGGDWDVVPDGTSIAGRTTIEGLKAENTSDTSDSISVYFTFVRDDEEVGEIRCSTGGSVTAGRTVTADCSPTNEDIEGYDEVEVHASW